MWSLYGFALSWSWEFNLLGHSFSIKCSPFSTSQKCERSFLNKMLTTKAHSHPPSLLLQSWLTQNWTVLLISTGAWRHLFSQQTNIGSILAAVNPYKQIPGLYDLNRVDLYSKHHLGELPPHIFAVANECYRCIWKRHDSQCVLIRSASTMMEQADDYVYGGNGDSSVVCFRDTCTYIHQEAE